MTDGLLDIDGAAAYLGISPRHMRDLWYAHRVPGVKVGARVRFRKSDLDRFCDENTVEAINA